MLTSEQIEKMTDDYLDLQIKELNEKELKEEKYINDTKKEIEYIFKHIKTNRHNYNFKFIEENDAMGNYNCVIDVQSEEYGLIIFNIHYYDDYSYIELMTSEQIQILKDYQKNKIEINDEEESEF